MIKNMKKRLRGKKGFTLIEMIIVIAIIAILIALIAPNLVEFLKTANETKANATAKTLYTSAQTYVTKLYVAGSPVGDKTVNKGDSSWTDFEKDFFNADELKNISAYSILIKGGAVEAVSLKMINGDEATYPQSHSTISGN